MKLNGCAFGFVCLLIFTCTCRPEDQPHKILGNIEDPQNEIAKTIAAVLNKNLTDSIEVRAGIGTLANLDSLEAGKADFGIVDNYARFSDRINAVLPLYPQVLHILHKRSYQPTSLHDLLTYGKVFAGMNGSGTKRFVDQLINDLGIDPATVKFVDILSLFEADVIISFTDLLTHQELRDLQEYQLYSIDDVRELGRGSLVEGICTRHPQFQPYIIARDLYGSFTQTPVLTLKVDAVLVCRADLDAALVYSVVEALMESRQDLKNINPLLYDVFMAFDAGKLNFAMHPGARNFLDRHEPTFLEKYAEVFSVIISIFVMLASSIYTISRWKKMLKKNKLDQYYNRVVEIRSRLAAQTTPAETDAIITDLKLTQEEAMQLVIKEKLMADESFSIFLNLSRLVMDEVLQKKIPTP